MMRWLDAAISEIGERYWAALYIFARSKGVDATVSADVVKLFFGELRDKDSIGLVDAAKGILRTLMEQVILSKEDDSGREYDEGELTFSIDQDREEVWFNSESVVGSKPESLYERRWALLMLEQSLIGIRNSYEKKGNENVFDALKPHLGWSAGDESFEEVAHRLEMSEGAVKVAVQRLRQKYKSKLQSQISDAIGTSDPELIRGEITYLFSALS